MMNEKEAEARESEGPVVTTSEWFEENMKKMTHYFFLCDTGIIIKPKHKEITITRSMITEILRYMNELKKNNNKNYSFIVIKEDN